MRRPDPGGIFASDEHRRVLGNCGSPRTLEQVADAVYRDTATNLQPGEEGDRDAEVGKILEELAKDGYVLAQGGFYLLNNEGAAALGARLPKDEPPPKPPEEARRLVNEFVEFESANVAEIAEQRKTALRAAVEAACDDIDKNVAHHSDDMVALKASVEDELASRAPEGSDA